MATCLCCGRYIPQLPWGNEVYHPNDLVCPGCSELRFVPGTDRPIITAICGDCGAEYHKPADRRDLLRCGDCAMRAYNRKVRIP